MAAATPATVAAGKVIAAATQSMVAATPATVAASQQGAAADAATLAADQARAAATTFLTNRSIFFYLIESSNTTIMVGIFKDKMARRVFY